MTNLERLRHSASPGILSFRAEQSTVENGEVGDTAT
jgi:hypothetical protein